MQKTFKQCIQTFAIAKTEGLEISDHFSPRQDGFGEEINPTHVLDTLRGFRTVYR